MFPSHHFVTIILTDQAAPDKGTEDALPHLRLHFGNGGCIKLCRRMKVHARFFVSSFGSVVHGANTSGREYPIHKQLNELSPDVPRVLLATGKLVGEGFDHPPLDTLVLSMPISWKGTLQQYMLPFTSRTRIQNRRAHL